ncbi:MAG TPA: hypothetical protein VJV78_15015 [Polyangiales bacterium]|nr:hypothetical protein [Polyangiales bacterium]
MKFPARLVGCAHWLALAACATSGAGAPPTTPQPTAAEPAPTAQTRPTPISRLLPQGATFADVVDIARALDAADHTRSEGGCLISNGPPRQFAADVLAGARPLPEVPRELASLLQKAAGAPAVITAWGNTPGELPDVALLAFTTTTPRSAKLPAVAMLLTGPGVFVRGAAMPLRAHPEALTPEAAATLLADLPDHAIVYVSAEAGVPVEQLVSALRSVPDRFEIGLAVALPKGTRLPAPTTKGNELSCPEGLPEPAADAVEGSLEASALRQVLAPLRDAGLSCALSIGGLALQGGRLELGLRVSPDGRARELCMVDDTIGEPLLRRCIIEAARSLTFPAPSPAGFVDVQLPMELTLEGPSAQRALCDSINAAPASP